MYWSIKYTGSCSNFFRLVGKFCVKRIEEVENIIVLYLQFLNTQNYILFKTSAWGLFLK